MNITDVDAQREYFMNCVYDILSDDETNDRANQIIDVFDSLVTDNEFTEREENGGWIKCSERMPEEHEDFEDVFDPVTMAVIDTVWHKISDTVLVTVRDGNQDKIFVSTDFLVDGKWGNYADGSFEVLAWQPLPEPYKESEEDTE